MITSLPLYLAFFLTTNWREATNYQFLQKYPQIGHKLYSSWEACNYGGPLT